MQLILLRDNAAEPLDCYRLKTVTYGTRPSAYLATKCLQKLAAINNKKFPLASRIAARDFYVDDLISGSDNLEEALECRNQLIQLMKSGGFNLRKWSANHPSLLNYISDDSCEYSFDVEKEKSSAINTLGMFWIPNADRLMFKTKWNYPNL